ncbi:addiction module toxin RelE [Deinococcus cavernae]|uniref:Addiction module toxin RelE n=2 Tax=Deinococcus cavernae TaxID=2320857 RepID=A0A418VCP7_9DEIO|nr:addiction module toxin RelE [Deinococcus cavernae]
MPRTWSTKDERQYQHVRESELAAGKSTEEAEEIASRTVNKHRREEGRTPNKRSMGTGNPDKPLGGLTRDELYNRARERRIAGRSRMSKAELMAALKG